MTTDGRNVQPPPGIPLINLPPESHQQHSVWLNTLASHIAAAAGHPIQDGDMWNVQQAMNDVTELQRLAAIGQRALAYHPGPIPVGTDRYVAGCWKGKELACLAILGLI